MKKLLYTSLIAATLGLTQNTKAQITLAHTFDGNAVYSAIEDWIVIPIVNYYVELKIESEQTQVKLYADDFSLYKTISITPPEGFKNGNVFGFSKNIFTDDDKVAFMIRYNKYVDGLMYETIILYDENGATLKDFGMAEYMWGQIYITSDNKFRFSVMKYILTNPEAETWEDRIYESKTEAYSLPGTISTTNAKLVPMSQSLQPPYPNPSNTTITLPYKLQSGETSVMRILNTNGQVMETKRIGSDFEQIQLNVSNYRKGMYIYEVNGVSNRFVVN
jgi:hypothetical protein